MKINTVGVIGCGIMGSGISQVCIQSGYTVVVSEIDEEALKKGLALITSSLNKLVEKGKLKKEENEMIISRLKGTTNTKAFIECELVIEAATENLDLKKRIFTDLNNTCSKDTILATNTSGQPILNIAMVTKRPDKVLGMHFFNPAPVMKLVEVIKTITTSEDTIKIAIEFIESLGKTVALVKDTPGFIVNRLATPYLLNAVRMLENGLASKEDIDNAMCLGLNYPIGPLRLLDLIGIDTVLFGASAMYEELKDPQYSPPILMEKMVTAGWFGQKTGKGFYNYK